MATKKAASTRKATKKAASKKASPAPRPATRTTGTRSTPPLVPGTTFVMPPPPSRF